MRREGARRQAGLNLAIPRKPIWDRVRPRLMVGAVLAVAGLVAVAIAVLGGHARLIGGP